MNFDFETVVAAAIILFFAIVVWRGGSKNPVGTGQLQSQMNTLGAKINTLEKSVGSCALATDVEHLRGELKDMQAGLASSAEVVALEGKIATVGARISGIERLAERTDAGVSRLESYFLKRGIDQ